MTPRHRIIPERRSYNQWVANQTLEDYALRFTAKSARRWSAARVANTALGSMSFLALEAIGGTLTVSYGFTNSIAAILSVSLLIFVISLPICFYAARDGVDMDLLTRGAGFGYIGSTVTSLIYATFTFIFFGIEAVIVASMLQIFFGVPLWLGYVVTAAAVLPLVTYGITFISRFQTWTQPVWLTLNLVALSATVIAHRDWLGDWQTYAGAAPAQPVGFDLLRFGACASILLALIAQTAEQVDYLRFLPPRSSTGRLAWWTALLAGGPGWIVIDVFKLLAGSFLAYCAIRSGATAEAAIRPAQMYLMAFKDAVASPGVALALTTGFVVLSQVKINVTNAYAGSIAWSNFFSRLTHSHPGRVVWLVFNIAIALLLMELGAYDTIQDTLGLYSDVAAAWIGALVADLVVNKPLGLSPPGIEFKRAHLYDVNPVGTGAMLLAVLASLAAWFGLLGAALAALSTFVAFAVAFAAAPLIAWGTRGRFYLSRKPRRAWASLPALQCSVCEHDFEPEDMAHCPVYAGPICSLCCSLDARCGDGCKPHARIGAQMMAGLVVLLPKAWLPLATSRFARLATAYAALVGAAGLVLLSIHARTGASAADTVVFWQAFVVLMVVGAVAAWLLVLAQESRRAAQAETQRQTALLMAEIRAHRRTDAALQRARDVAETASEAKSNFVTSINHELRSPLNAILGYVQLLERDPASLQRRPDALRIIRRSGEHLAALVEGLLDISRIEAKRIDIYRDEVMLPEFLGQLGDMFRLQAEEKGIGFVYERPDMLPSLVHTDERRLRQILINLLSNAVKFTPSGAVTLRVRWRAEIAEFEVADTGIGIAPEHLERIFEPLQRVKERPGRSGAGPGAGPDHREGPDGDHGRRDHRRQPAGGRQLLPRAPHAVPFNPCGAAIAVAPAGDGIRRAAPDDRGRRRRPGASHAARRPPGAARLHRAGGGRRPGLPGAGRGGRAGPVPPGPVHAWHGWLAARPVLAGCPRRGADHHHLRRRAGFPRADAGGALPRRRADQAGRSSRAARIDGRGGGDRLAAPSSSARARPRLARAGPDRAVAGSGGHRPCRRPAHPAGRAGAGRARRHGGTGRVAGSARRL